MMIGRVIDEVVWYVPKVFLIKESFAAAASSLYGYEKIINAQQKKDSK